MSALSLRLRLLSVGGLAIAVALAIAAVVLAQVFKRHVERRVGNELNVLVNQIVAGLDRGAGVDIELVRPPGEPRFDRPLSGLYWQILIERDGRVLRSRSLWDTELSLPAVPSKGRNADRLAGPANTSLYYLDRRVTLPPRLDNAAARVAVALDAAEINEVVNDFKEDLVPSLLLIGGLLLAATLAQVTVGLLPLGTVRERLAGIRSGSARRLGPGLPEEFKPLAIEIDALLDARDEQVERARTRSADLAHALKTPLQVLKVEADGLQAKGELEIAKTVADLASTMNRQVQRELTRARIAPRTAQAAANIGEVAKRVAAVMRRTPDGQRLDWTFDMPPGLTCRIDADDLAEMLGNLIENAATHARSRIAIAGVARPGEVLVTITDDGPGIPAAQLGQALSRGGRLDTKGTGAGLGLAIVSDIADAWGATCAFEDAGPGLKVCLRLPGV